MTLGGGGQKYNAPQGLRFVHATKIFRRSWEMCFMKHVKNFFALLVAMMTVLAFVACSNDSGGGSDDGGGITITESDGTIVVTGEWNYDASSYSSYGYKVNEAISSSESESVSVDLSGITGVTTADGSLGLGSSAKLVSVTFPASVTKISHNAISHCTNLTSIEVAAGNTAYKSIGGILYSYDEKTLVFYPIGRTNTSFEIHDGVTTIGDYAFYCARNLKSITIPDSVTTIGEHAFYNCTSLTSITIPDKVTTIGEYAFYSSFSHFNSTITIGSGVTEIGFGAFGKANFGSATFNNTSGWKAGSTELTGADLQNTTTAATYLKSTYYDCYWHRSDSSSSSN